MLGPWKACFDAEAPVVLPTRQARALLARLVISHPQPVSRAALLADLFPDLPAETAARRLRSTRYYLRRALGEFLHSDDEQTALDPALEIVSDYASFEAGTHPGASPADLDAAIMLYRGPFLDSAADGWAQRESQRLHIRYIDALRRRIALAQATGRLEEMVPAARRWVVEEPWEELAHIALLHGLLALGDRAAALAHLARARALLRTEWGSLPGAAFEELARTITRQSEAAPGEQALLERALASPARPVASGAGAIAVLDAIDFDRLPLIGRDQLFAHLTQAWAQTCQGHPRVLVLEGASGVGKSRLVHELAARVRLRAENLVLWCIARTHAPDQWLRTLGEAFARLAEPQRAFVAAVCHSFDELTWGVLCQWLPELRRLVPDQASQAPPLLAPDAAVARRRAALRTLLERLAAQRPLLLVLDDVLAFDSELLALIQAIAASGSRVYILITRLPGRLQEGAEERSDSLPGELITVAPLDDHAVRQLVGVVLGGAVDANLLERLAQQSGGNPLFVHQILRMLVEQQALRWDRLLGWQLALPDIDLPGSVTELLVRRLDQLSPFAQALAQLLAVLGRPTEQVLLEALWPDEETRLAAQAELLEHSVVVERGDRLRFDHTWLEENILRTLDRTTCAALHRQIAAVLRVQPGADPADLMDHAAGAADWPAALEDALATAERALAERQQATLRRALDVAEQAVDALGYELQDTRRWPLIRLRERYHAQVEHGPIWESDLAELDALAFASGRVDWQIEALTRNGLAQREVCQPAAAEGLLRRAAVLAEAAQLPLAETWARLWLIGALDEQGTLDAALAECEAAARAASATGDPELSLHVLITLGYIQMRAGRVDEAVALLRGLEEHPVVQKRPAIAMGLMYRAGEIRLAARDYTGGLAALRESVRHAQSVGDVYGVLVGQSSLCLALATLGLFAESRTLGEATLPLARQLNNTRYQGVLLYSLASAAFYGGDAAAAEPLALEGAALAERGYMPEYGLAQLGLAAQIAVALDRPAEAFALLQRAEHLPNHAPSAQSASAAAQVWLALGHPDRAAQTARAALRYADEHSVLAATTGAALWEAAEVLSQLGVSAAASTLRERALTRFLSDLDQLSGPETRRAFIAARATHHALAAYAGRGRQRLVYLPLHNAPTGRPLHADELAPVIWRIDAPQDTEQGVAHRQRQVQDLAATALAQGAVATVAALADALAVTSRTIKRDLQVLRQVGIAVETRHSVLRSGRRAPDLHVDGDARQGWEVSQEYAGSAHNI
jgi:DNA-binding SARP family transcriptional activator